mgnify:CR=1 FL=1
MTDNDVYVRITWLQRTDFTPTPKQIKKGINDQHVQVLMAWLERKDIKWSEDDIQRELAHEYKDIRKKWEEVLLRQNAAESDDHSVWMPMGEVL